MISLLVLIFLVYTIRKWHRRGVFNAIQREYFNAILSGEAATWTVEQHQKVKGWIKAYEN